LQLPEIQWVLLPPLPDLLPTGKTACLFYWDFFQKEIHKKYQNTDKNEKYYYRAEKDML